MKNKSPKELFVLTTSEIDEHIRWAHVTTEAPSVFGFVKYIEFSAAELKAQKLVEALKLSESALLAWLPTKAFEIINEALAEHKESGSNG